MLIVSALTSISHVKLEHRWGMPIYLSWQSLAHVPAAGTGDLGKQVIIQFCAVLTNRVLRNMCETKRKPRRVISYMCRRNVTKLGSLDFTHTLPYLTLRKPCAVTIALVSEGAEAQGRSRHSPSSQSWRVTEPWVQPSLPALTPLLHRHALDAEGLDALSSLTFLEFCSMFAGLQNTAGNKAGY